MKKIIACLIALAFCVIALAGCSSVSKELTAAKDYLYSMYKDNAEVTPSDYQVVGALNVSGVTYGVEWTVDVTSGDKEGVKTTVGEDKMVTVDVNEKTEAEIVYILTAKITDPKGKSTTVSFNHKVPQFKELSWAEYVAAATDDTVVVKGVVTAIMAKSKGNSYNCLYLEDADGGYYVYNTATDPVTDDKVEIGMTVRVTGKRDTYSGTYEIMSGAVEILDTNKKTVTPADYTEKFKSAQSLKDTAIVEKQSSLVTLKGVEITGEDVTNGYFKFKLGSLETYVRISSSVCPITKDEQASFKAEHASHLGWTADVTGIICVYDGAFYLTPVTEDAFVYVSLPEKDDAGMVAFEKDNLTLTDAVTNDTEIALPSEGKGYSKVKITWTSDNACAVVDGGKLKVTLPDADTVVKVTAVISSGDAIETVVFDVKVDGASAVKYIAKPVAGATEGTFKFVLAQNKLGKVLYFDGTVNASEYLASTEKAEKAADVTVAAVDGGYTLKVGDKFIEVYTNAAGKVRPTLVETSTGVWTWDADANVYTFTLGEKVYYLGTYNTFDTFSASETKYITGDNAKNVDVSQFPGRFCTVAEADYKSEAMTEVKEGTYKFVLFQNKIGKVLYFDGTVNASEYLASTEKADKAADVTVAAVDGGYTLKVGEKFIEVYTNAAGKVRPTLVETSTGAWTWDADAKVFTFTLGEKVYYLGTYNTFDTFSASETKYITGDNAKNVDISQFPGRFCTLTLKEVTNTALTEAKEGTYKFVLFQNKIGKVLYFDGTVNASEYLVSTEKADKAADVTVAAVDGGYTLKVGEKFIEVYTNDAGKVRPTLVETSTGAWTWDADAKVFTFTLGEKVYYLGTYNTYDTFSASETKYITGDNAKNVDVSQFPGRFVTRGFAD